MTALYAFGSAALGTALSSRTFCLISRIIGAALIAIAVFVFAAPAFAAGDQTLMAADGAQLTCNASEKDLTRISLVGDEFANVTKIKTGVPTDDFSVVNEPVRGDIYLSVPEGFQRQVVSFFGTTKRGYVYKFQCRVSGDQAVQVFVSNPAIEKADAAEAGQTKVASASTPEDAAVSLVQAMYANKSVDGYEMRQRSLKPVYVGSLPVCACGSPVPRIGISAGFWEPVRLADVSTKPWCFVNLGGTKISPGFDIGQGQLSGPSQTGGNGQNTSKWHVHWYVYPLLYWMEILADFACFEQSSFDIAYMTEVDPLWQDDSLTALINPEAVLFSTPIAQAACAGDCIASTAKLPLDATFWCAGCQGPMYPVNGNISASIGHVQASRLALARFAFKIHREGLAWGTMGSKGLCNKYPMPVLRKQQYRTQMVNPIPTVSGKAACLPLGGSTMPPQAGRSFPVKGEDMGYLVWRKRNCCVL